MRIFNFNKSKYHREILIDAGSKSAFHGYCLEAEEHATDFYELIFWEAGSGFLVLDDRKIELKTGTVLFIPPYKKRKWLVKKTAVSFHIILFREDFLNEFLKNHLFLSNLPFFFNRNAGILPVNKVLWKEVLKLTKKISAEIRQLQPDSDILLSAQLIYLLSVLRREYAATYSIAAESPGHILAHRFRELLETGLNAGHGVAHYAGKLSTTRITLNKYCLAAFGLTAGELIRQRLLYEVKSKLLYSALSLKEIAGILGFKETSNLSRFFHHSTGMTSSEYKKKYAPGLYF
jgi:AraC family transcriptional activator of pobA